MPFNYRVAEETLSCMQSCELQLSIDSSTSISCATKSVSITLGLLGGSCRSAAIGRGEPASHEHVSLLPHSAGKTLQIKFYCEFYKTTAYSHKRGVFKGFMMDTTGPNGSQVSYFYWVEQQRKPHYSACQEQQRPDKYNLNTSVNRTSKLISSLLIAYQFQVQHFVLTDL